MWDWLNPFKWSPIVFSFLQMTWLHSLWLKDYFECTSVFFINPVLLDTNVGSITLAHTGTLLSAQWLLVSLWCVHLESWCEHKCGIKVTWEIQIQFSEQSSDWLPWCLGSLTSPRGGFPFLDILVRISRYLFSYWLPILSGIFLIDRSLPVL